MTDREADPLRTVHIACLQTRPLATFDEAIAAALPLAQAAADGGAQLLCLPEYCGGFRIENGRLAPPAAVEEQHPVLDALRNFAAKAGVWVLIGSIAVTGLRKRILNRSYMIADNGEIRARYDKIHLFDVELSPSETYRESAVIDAGNKAVLVDTPWARLGLTVCYDLRFPQLYRDLAQAGAEILAVPAAFMKITGEAHWHILNRARAIENGAVVIAPGAVGEVPGGGQTYGHSLVIDAWGAVLSDGGEEVGFQVVEVDLTAVATARHRLPVLDHERAFCSANSGNVIPRIAR